MLASFLPAALSATRAFLRQTIPSLVATLAAAALIAGYNHTFRLTQPRMAALDSVANAEPAPPAPAAARPAATTTVPMTKPPVGPVTEYITIHEVGEPERAAEKLPSVDSPKEQGAVKIAAPAPAPAPRAAAVTPRIEPRVVERRVEPRVASVPAAPAPMAQIQVIPAPAPVAAAPMPATQAPIVAVAPPVVVVAPPAVALEPPPVVTAKPSYVIVPDRPTQQRPVHEANADELPPPPPQGPIGMIVNTLKPSAIFARAREFGERIEAAGNEILPNIRPQ